MDDPDLQRSITGLEGKLGQIAKDVDSIKHQKKDFLDVVSALGGILVAIVGAIFTYYYQAGESKKNEQLQRHNARIAEIQAYATFITYLVSTNQQEQKLATVGVVRLWSDEEARQFLAQVTNSVVESTKRDIAVSETRPSLLLPVSAQFAQTSLDSYQATNEVIDPAPAVSLLPRQGDWSRGSFSDVNTWAVLYSLKQITKPFPEAGRVRSRDFAFWSKEKTPETRRLAAQALAVQFDRLFRGSHGAQYQKGIDSAKATSTLRLVLLDPNKTASDLSDAVGQLYEFAGASK